MRRPSVRSLPLSLQSVANRAAARLRGGAEAGDAGMTTAEYAVGTVAACGFAGVLFKVISSPEVYNAVKAAVLRALQVAF